MADPPTQYTRKSYEFSPIAPSTLSNPINIPAHQQKSDFLEDDRELYDSNSDVAFFDEEGRSRNPVRRVNSSPEMSSNWKNHFISRECVFFNRIGNEFE